MLAGLTGRKGWAALLEVLAWWAALTGLWMVLITTVDPVETVVGAAVALPAAACARAARRAARQEVISG